VIRLRVVRVVLIEKVEREAQVDVERAIGPVDDAGPAGETNWRRLKLVLTQRLQSGPQAFQAHSSNAMILLRSCTADATRSIGDVWAGRLLSGKQIITGAYVMSVRGPLWQG
jgi:hypothetical protein